MDKLFEPLTYGFLFNLSAVGSFEGFIPGSDVPHFPDFILLVFVDVDDLLVL